jgi:hypothetical protein
MEKFSDKAVVKGIMPSVEYFFLKAYTIKSVLSVHTQMVFKFLACLVQEKNEYEVFACSLKSLTNSKNRKPHQTSVRLSFALIGGFFPVYIHSRLSEQFQDHIRGFGTTFKDTGCNQKAGTSSLKKLEGNSQFRRDFIEASRNFFFDFPHKKTTKNSKSTVLILRTFKNNNPLVTLSL